MTAKRGKSRKALSTEMVNELLAEPGPEIESVPEDAPGEAQEDAPHRPATRRPVEPGKDAPDKPTLLTRAEQVMRIAASLGVAAAAILGVIEYSNANEDKRRERSLEIVRDWETSNHIDRYTAVQLFVESKVSDPALRTTLSALPEDALSDAQANLGRSWTAALRDSDAKADQDMEAAIDRLMIFFAQMEICIASELCNAEVLRAYFGREVSSFWTYFSGYAKLRQAANYEGYGEPVGRLVARFAEGSTP